MRRAAVLMDKRGGEEEVVNRRVEEVREMENRWKWTEIKMRDGVCILN